MTMTEQTALSEIISINPADGSVAGRVAETDFATLDQVVETAWQAYRNSGWAQLMPHQRADTLRAIADALLQEKPALAELQMRDNGKPLSECRGMVDYAVGAFRYYASACETLETPVTPSRGQYLSFTVLEPYGVVASITPWNSPLMNDATKVAPALAAGNAVIMKPSEDAPLMAGELVRIAEAAGLPAGQLQVVQGRGAQIGAALVAHPGVRMVSFTGGTTTGQAIGKAAADKVMPVALELGGKSPHIIFDDADLELAEAGVIAGIFGSSGQSCVAGSRVFIQRSIYDAVLARLVARAKQIKVAAPEAEGVEMGPLVSVAHRDKVDAFVQRAVADGAQLLCGGKAPEGAEFAKGAYYLPTILAERGPDSYSCQTEAFGPVMSVLPFDSEESLIAMANGTAFGLAAGLWTEDFKKAWRVGRAIEAGSCWINTYKQSVTSTPFGGFKTSGIGREKGLDGLRLYGQVKSMFLGLQTAPAPVAK